jgi:hypothetical protein
LVFVVLIAIASSVFATEPDGHFQLQTRWVQPNAHGGPPIVRLSIRSLVPLDEATLTVSVPLDFVMHPVAPSAQADFDAVPAPPGRSAIRASLRRLETVAPSTFDFELSVLPGGHGILEFIVEGRDSSGRTIRNAIGLAAGDPPAGVHRLGAIEFPAAVLPPTEKR